MAVTDTQNPLIGENTCSSLLQKLQVVLSSGLTICLLFDAYK